MKIDRTRLPRQARYWTLHCCINALPSFIVAAFYLQIFFSLLVLQAKDRRKRATEIVIPAEPSA
ncbi:hypothetical protein [Haloferula sp. A504]|uniref:hypothetical protein n=1 Tax=Haloferula sp. A504 TaxID=3373601 RepID=UPI0031C0D18B|nr:hypothetical protein [Verrucomicrobiaceae bacterium E54]